MEGNALFSLLEKILLGAVGGVVAYWLARKRFVSERWWDKRFEIYIETVDILNRFEHLLSQLLSRGRGIQWGEDPHKISTIDDDYNNICTELHHLNQKHFLVSSKEINAKLLSLYALLGNLQTGDHESLELARRQVAGIRGEISIYARNELMHSSFRRIVARIWHRVKSLKT